MRKQLVCWMALFSLPLAAAADWPTFQNNNARVATTNEELAAPLTLRWMYRSPVAPQPAWEGPRNTPIEGHVMRHRVKFDDAMQVVAADGRAYFGSVVDHKVYCVDAQTGAPIWSFFTEGPVRLAPTIHDGRVYVGSDDGMVYCLNAADGRLVWKMRPTDRDERLLARGQMISRWPIRTGVLVDDDVAYFGAGIFPHETVYLCAVDAATGEVIWKNDSISQQNAGRNDLSPQGYLLCNDELLFVPSGRSLPIAFHKQTGEMVHGRKHQWRTTAGGVVGGTGAVLGDGQIYSSGPHHFLAMDQTDGDIGAAWIPGRQMTFAGDKAYIATGDAVIKVDRAEHARASIKRQELFLKLRRATAEQRTTIEKERTRLAKVGIEWAAANTADGALAACENLLFAGGSGRLTAYDTESGEVIWQADVDGDVRGIAISDGLVIATTTGGKIYGFGDAELARTEEKVQQWPKSGTADRVPEGEQIYQDVAKRVLAKTGVRRGFCLVLEGGEGELAHQLAKASDLTIIVAQSKPQKVQTARRKLAAAGLYGHRVHVIQTNLDEVRLPSYFANLIVNDRVVRAEPPDATILQRAARHLKPMGGKICIGTAPDGAGKAHKVADDCRRRHFPQLFGKDEAEIDDRDDSYALLTRGALPGAGIWSHQYGDAGNTSNSRDHRVKGEMGVLWYGDPGPSQMINRHEGAMAPLSVGGRMFIQGEESIMAYDIYNGLFLWERKNPGALRTGVFDNEDTSNLAATEDALFVCVDDTCTEYDAATGEVRRVHRLPKTDDDLARAWAYVAVSDGKLYGTSTVRSELRRELRRRGRKVANATDSIFAVDLASGEQAWVYRGKNIMHMTIAIADGRVHFIDSSITSEQRQAFLREDKAALARLTGEARQKAEKELKRRDVRLAVALDAADGETLWSKPVDVTDCSHVGIGGGQMTLMASDGHVVVCGANANGHFWRQFLSGEFSRRRLLVFDAETGAKKWAKDANYRHRPIVVGDQIIAEPWAFDLASGNEVKRTHPLTGEPTKWSFSRPGHHCGAISASPNTLFFRSGFIGYYDLYDDSGTRHFAGQRLGCWINALPAGGVVAVPEASAGCVCLFSIASTVVLEPRDDRKSWGIYSAQGSQTPVRHMAINFGAPGDRRDDQGRLWLAFPRPRTVGRLEYVFDIAPKLHAGGGYYAHNDESLEIQNTQVPWVYTSGVRGLSRCEIPLRGKDDGPAKYTVKLHFAALNKPEATAPAFDIRIGDEVVAKDVRIVKESGGLRRAWTLTFDDIAVARSLTLQMVADGANTLDELPTIAAIEVQQQD